MSCVLVVDDEPDIRLLTALTLETAGHDVIEAETGERALEILETRRVDLVLLDLALPGIDGWGVLARLHRRGQLPGTKVVVLSAWVDAEIGARALAEGCSGYLSKPCRAEELTAFFEQSGS